MVKNIKHKIIVLAVGFLSVLYPIKSLSSEKEYDPNDVITATNAVDALWYLLKEKYPESHEMHSFFKYMYKEEGYSGAYNDFLEDFNRCENQLQIHQVVHLRKSSLYRQDKYTYFVGKEPIIKAMCQGKSLNQVEKESK